MVTAESPFLLFLMEAWKARLRKRTTLHLHVQGRRPLKGRDKQASQWLQLTDETTGKLEQAAPTE